jgi:alanyl-tRNA synthetase
MERRLYCDSPYVTDWQAEVTGVIEKGGKYHVSLTETAFYPGGSGQPPDRGTIEDIAAEGR